MHTKDGFEPGAPEPGGESRRQGIPASYGIGIGRAYLVDRKQLKVPQRHIEPDEVDDEVQRFEVALQRSDRQLERLKQKLESRAQSEHYNIIAAHQLMLHDEHLVDEALRFIKTELINAEWALQRTLEHIRGVFDSIEDEYFRERRSDIDFVGDRVMRNLLGKKPAPVRPPPDAIVVAHDLSPSDTAQLYRAAVAGLVTDAGGKTSHTAIIARAHEIPAVVGLEIVTELVESGDLIIVDGAKGVVIVNPDPETVVEYRELARKQAVRGAVLLGNRLLPAETLDGVTVGLVANIDQLDEIPGAIDHGAEGIGLFRTEFSLMTQDGSPSEEDQYEMVRSVIELMGGRKATVRTYDLGADKTVRLLGADQHPEVNPALGLRSLRLCLTPSVLPQFKAQLRAFLRAAAHGPLRIMFPMISGLSELEDARAVLDEVATELRESGVEHGTDYEMGIMVEMPSAAIVSDLLAPHVDFFSIGTNDLIQYTLAVDRVNEHVSYLYQPLHPAILRLIRQVVQAGRKHGIQVSICGEMAGDPFVVPVLVGLGLDELSMNSAAIPEVKSVIRSCAHADLQLLAKDILGMPTVRQVRSAVREYFKTAKIDTSRLHDD